MKKKILQGLLALLLLGAAAEAEAQKCVVYTMVGKAEVVTERGKRNLYLREIVGPQTVLNIPYNGAVELLDQVAQKKYVIKTPGKATVAAFLKDKRNQEVSLSKRLFKYMMKRASGTSGTFIQSCSDPATVTREELVDSTVYVVKSSEP